MPHIDQEAKAWEMAMAGRVGEAVAARRKALGMTAVQLAAKTREIGYPISRVAISKIETNSRAGKLDVAELIVLAVALDVSPVAVLYPNLPEGEVERLPGDSGSAAAALFWFTGEHDEPDEPPPGGLGRLLKLTRDRYNAMFRLDRQARMAMRAKERGEEWPLIDYMDQIHELDRWMAAIPGSVVDRYEERQ